MAFLRWMEEVMQNVVSIGIGVIPKMDLVTTKKKKKKTFKTLQIKGIFIILKLLGELLSL